MRSRVQIVDVFYKEFTGGETGVRTDEEHRQLIMLEVLLDIRDLLAEKKQRKILTTEVNLTDREKELLEALEN